MINKSKLLDTDKIGRPKGSKNRNPLIALSQGWTMCEVRNHYLPANDPKAFVKLALPEIVDLYVNLAPSKAELEVDQSKAQEIRFMPIRGESGMGRDDGTFQEVLWEAVSLGLQKTIEYSAIAEYASRWGVPVFEPLDPTYNKSGIVIPIEKCRATFRNIALFALVYGWDWQLKFEKKKRQTLLHCFPKNQSVFKTTLNLAAYYQDDDGFFTGFLNKSDTENFLSSISYKLSRIITLDFPIEINEKLNYFAHVKSEKSNYTLNIHSSPIALAYMHLFAIQESELGLSYCEVCMMPFVVQRFREDSQNPNEYRLKRTCYSKCKNTKFAK